MSLITIAEGLAKNVGMQIPDVVMTSPDRSWQEALEFANEVGDELARRFDWPQLFADATLTGTGADAAISLPSDFDRFPAGVNVRYSGAPVRSLTHGEWAALTAYEGAPRYFLRAGSTVRLWPYLAASDEAQAYYISADWCDGGASFQADTDETIFGDDLFTLGLIVRWRRQKGMPYSDEEAEFEAALQDYANFSGAARF